MTCDMSRINHRKGWMNSQSLEIFSTGMVHQMQKNSLSQLSNLPRVPKNMNPFSSFTMDPKADQTDSACLVAFFWFHWPHFKIPSGPPLVTQHHKWTCQEPFRESVTVVFRNWRVVLRNWERYSETGKLYSETGELYSETGIRKLEPWYSATRT